MSVSFIPVIMLAHQAVIIFYFFRTLVLNAIDATNKVTIPILVEGQFTVAFQKR